MLPILRSLGPAVARPPATEAVRAGLGALIGLGLTGMFVLTPAIDRHMGLFLIAPFGATSVLLFAVPNSPLAQPWSAVVGNTVAALAAIWVCMLVSDPMLRIVLAVSTAITATILCRALHPPAGAVAMTVAMNPDMVAKLGFQFAIVPVAAGTILLVLIAMAYAKLTGRHYPLRQFDEPNHHGTKDAEPAERLGLSEAELTGILERYRQSFNLGVEDLARLIGAAETVAASHQTGPLTTEDIMSRDLVTVEPDAPLADIADLFRQYKFTSLPVVDAAGQFAGVIFQIHLIAHVRENARRLKGLFSQAMTQLRNRDSDIVVRAKDIMDSRGPRATVDTPLGALFPLMSEGNIDAVPVLDGTRIVGIVTRTDLIVALVRNSLRQEILKD
ncbi:HPP family protein [Pseudorhodobacter aquimaris]|nr:HPP family protein [Pseudorhodobacter aquimaris]